MRIKSFLNREITYDRLLFSENQTSALIKQSILYRDQKTIFKNIVHSARHIQIKGDTLIVSYERRRGATNGKRRRVKEYNLVKIKNLEE